MTLHFTPMSVRKIALGICELEGISVVEDPSSTMVPSANLETKVITLGRFDLTKSKEYLWHMFHELGHLFPENLWHFEAIKLMQSNEHPLKHYVLNTLADYLADYSKHKVYPGRDRCLAEGLDDHLSTVDLVKDRMTVSKLLGALVYTDLNLRSQWQHVTNYRSHPEIEDLVSSLYALDYEDRLKSATVAEDLKSLTEDILKLEDPKETDEQELKETLGDSTNGATVPVDSEEPTEITRKPYALSSTVETIRPREELANNMRSSAIKVQLDQIGLTKNLRKNLLISQVTRYSGGKKSGVLHGKSLYRSSLQRTDVFKTKATPRLNINIAVELLMDCSGSMIPEKYYAASACLIVLIELLQDLGIPVEARGFTVGDDHRKELTTVVDLIFKEFNDPPVSRDRMISRLSSADIDHNANADGESLMIAHDSLLRQRNKRKLMIVLSDGRPTVAPRGREPESYLKEVTDNIERHSPVELVALGILYSSVHGFYKNASTVRTLRELEPTLLSIIKPRLIL